MGTQVKLTAEDGHSLDAYRADPAGPPKGGIVVIQEIFGVNSHVQSVADLYAEKGYVAIAPALFDRIETGIDLGYNMEGATKGREIMGKLDLDDVIKDVAAAAKEIKDAGTVGSVGYCWGGTVSWLAGTRLGLPAVSYYGGRIVDFANEKPGAAAMLHFGATDQMIPAEDVDKIRAAHADVPVFVYPDSGHGFNCDQRGDFNPDSAALALERTLGFFAEHVG